MTPEEWIENYFKDHPDQISMKRNKKFMENLSERASLMVLKEKDNFETKVSGPNPIYKKYIEEEEFRETMGTAWEINPRRGPKNKFGEYV